MVMLQRFALMTLFAFLVGCSSGKLVKTYEGEALPANQLASLTAGENLVLVSVNGEKVPEYLLSNISVSYGLKPGPNKVVFQYESVWAKPRADEDDSRSEAVVSALREVDIDARAGQKLSFAYDEADNVREARALAAKFEADVVDQAGKVLARSHDVTAVPMESSEEQVTSASVAGPVEKTAGLPAMEAMKLLWNEMSQEEQKAFLKWAFQ